MPPAMGACRRYARSLQPLCGNEETAPTSRMPPACGLGLEPIVWAGPVVPARQASLHHRLISLLPPGAGAKGSWWDGRDGMEQRHASIEGWLRGLAEKPFPKEIPEPLYPRRRSGETAAVRPGQSGGHGEGVWDCVSGDGGWHPPHGLGGGARHKGAACAGSCFAASGVGVKMSRWAGSMPHRQFKIVKTYFLK